MPDARRLLDPAPPRRPGRRARAARTPRRRPRWPGARRVVTRRAMLWPTLWLAAMAAALCALTAATDVLLWRLGGWTLIGAFAIGTGFAWAAVRIAGAVDRKSALAVIL